MPAAERTDWRTEFAYCSPFPFGVDGGYGEAVGLFAKARLYSEEFVARTQHWGPPLLLLLLEFAHAC